MFDVNKIQTFHLSELSGKKLTMFYSEDDGFGILAGKDELTGEIYIISEVKK